MLKAVLFDFNGIIINDEPLHQKLIDQLLIEENLRPKPEEYWQTCVGRSDRACLTDLLTQRGRVVTDKYLNDLIARKSRAYQQQLQAIDKLPIYPGLTDLIFQLRSSQIKMAVVSGAVRAEIELVLERSQLAQHFSVIVAGDEITQSKPEPEGYLLAVKRLNQQFPDLLLQPNECLAIEDTFAGIEAAKRAGIQVVGVANTYPFHMMQRQANWAVDYLMELELDRIRDRFSGVKPRQTVG
ncbi:MAG: HAD family phosphatase [Oculatellaceae cyanobacterium bins.114]|nr:HAD family phosphatase [Oculatellaceae cyanobacterium bins.114]